MNKQFAIGSLARVAARARNLKIYRILPQPWHAALRKAWHFLIGIPLLGDIPFNFDAEVSGIKFCLRAPYRYLANDYYFIYLTEGAYEVQATAHITQVVRESPNPRVLDVGAHYGWYTIYLAKLIANRGTVYAFEPSETVFLFLKQNVESNDLHNVRLYKQPLSDKRETVSMVVSKDRPYEARYMHSITGPEIIDSHSNTLRAITFDEINEKEEIHPNIVKIDVHGNWKKIINGMRLSLQRDIEHLYVELDTPSHVDLVTAHSDIRYVISMLRDIGMDVYEIRDFRKRDGGNIITADENQIINTGYKTAMLYAVKRKQPY